MQGNEDAVVTENKKILRDKTKNISYVKGKLLGTGGFAKCYEAISQEDGKLYAAKVIPKKSINEKRQRYKLLIEIKIHKGLKHKYIVEFIDAFEDKENIYILLEYCRNYTLKDLVKRRKRLTQFETRTYISQVVKALIYIHQQGVIHRDLKLGNILINDQMDSKICDFGLSTKIKSEGEVKKTICGTPNYIAPQILEEQGHSYEVDIWSIGVIMYTLLFGKPPFEDNTVEQTYENIKNNRFVFPTTIAVSISAKDLINKILVMDPNKRLSLKEILEHQFMQLPEGVPHNLPVSSLAVPPKEYDKLPARINLNDMHLELSEELNDDDEHSYLQEQRVKFKESSTLNQNNKKGLNFIYIRECFKYQDYIGYLLSNGVVGIFHKKTNLNLKLEFGQENYYLIKHNQKPLKKVVPEEYELDENLEKLFQFKAFFVQKYSLFKMQEMKKRSGDSEAIIYVKKGLTVRNMEMVTRLSNNIIQLHFSDLTSLAINRDDEKGVYLISAKGKESEINYNQCQNSRLKTKVRRFSHLIQLLSPKEPSEDQNEQNDEQAQESQSYEEEQADESDSQ